MPTPSLILVPARFKTGKLYTPLATTSGGVVLGASGDFNVTRATTATRVNASGRIESVASGIPRLDYYTSGGTAGCPALLVEPSGQNVVVQSQNWLASGWRSDVSGNVTTVSATTGTLDPLGTNTANAISPTSGNTSHLKIGSDGSASFTSGTIYTASAFFKQGTGNAGRYVQIAWPATRFAANTFANFDLQLGTVALVTGSTVTAGIENYGNGWYRCRCTNTCISTGTGANGISIALIETSGATRLPTFTGTTTDVLYGWGAQTETGSVATSYIPTTTAAVTRNADVISLSGAVSGCIGQTEGSIYAEVNIQKLLGATQRAIVDIGQSGNRLFLGYGNGLTNQIRFLLQTSLGGLVDINSSATSTGTIKIAVGYKNNDSIMYVNGVSGTVLSNDNFTSSLNALTGLSIGSSNIVSETHFLNDRIRAVALYTTRLTNAELAALTTP
jgi:hypothetical protein